MAIEAIKKAYPINDEQGRPSTYPTFSSQVFSDGDGRALYQEGKGICADAAKDSDKLGGVDAGDYALKTDIPEDSGVDFLSIYPVGSIYMSVSSTSPAGLFGGTWEMLKNRFLIGAGGSYTNGGTGGKTGYALRAAIGAINSDPSHIGYCYTSAMTYQTNATSACYGLDASSEDISKWNHSTIVTEHTSTSSTTTIIPPYLAVYMWKRVS